MPVLKHPGDDCPKNAFLGHPSTFLMFDLLAVWRMVYSMLPSSFPSNDWFLPCVLVNSAGLLSCSALQLSAYDAVLIQDLSYVQVQGIGTHPSLLGSILRAF